MGGIMPSIQHFGRIARRTPLPINFTKTLYLDHGQTNPNKEYAIMNLNILLVSNVRTLRTSYVQTQPSMAQYHIRTPLDQPRPQQFQASCSRPRNAATFSPCRAVANAQGYNATVSVAPNGLQCHASAGSYHSDVQSSSSAAQPKVPRQNLRQLQPADLQRLFQFPVVFGNNI